MSNYPNITAPSLCPDLKIICGVFTLQNDNGIFKIGVPRDLISAPENNGAVRSALIGHQTVPDDCGMTTTVLPL